MCKNLPEAIVQLILLSCTAFYASTQQCLSSPRAQSLPEPTPTHMQMWSPGCLAALLRIDEATDDMRGNLSSTHKVVSATKPLLFPSLIPISRREVLKKHCTPHAPLPEAGQLLTLCNPVTLLAGIRWEKGKRKEERILEGGHFRRPKCSRPRLSLLISFRVSESPLQ